MRNPHKVETTRYLNIQSIKHLASQIGTSPEDLTDITTNITKHYSMQPDTKIKDDGSIKIRNIYHPTPVLKKVLSSIDTFLLKKICLHEAVHGSRKGCSNITNALIHVGQPVILTADIKDFYPSITRDLVYKTWQKLNCSPVVAECLTVICTADNHLPQGYNTSPRLANLILAQATLRIDALCKQQRFKFTSLVDDLTISGSKDPTPLLKTIDKIIGEYGLSRKHEKNFCRRKCDQQKVTGIIVNEKANIEKKRFASLRLLLYKCQQLGPAVVMKTVTNRKKKPFASIEEFKAHLTGRVGYCEYVNPQKAQKLIISLNRIPW